MSRAVFFRCTQIDEVDCAMLLCFELRQRLRVDGLHSVSIRDILRGLERLLEMLSRRFRRMPLGPMFQFKATGLPGHGPAI